VKDVKQQFSLLVLATALSAGCTVGTEETLAEADAPATDVEQAFTESACPTLTPDALLTVTGSFDEALASTTGANYGESRCTRAFKVNVKVSQAATGSVYTFWQGPFPQTRASCVNAKAFLRLYEKVGANWVVRAATTSLPRWTGTTCVGLFAWSDVQNIGNGREWMAIAQGVGSDNKLRPIDVLLLSY
jgi:hypothetical protein